MSDIAEFSEADRDNSPGFATAIFAKAVLPVLGLLAFAMTLYTTFQGALQILPHWSIAAGLTALATSMLVGTSFHLAQLVSDRRRYDSRLGVILISLLGAFCFLACAFCSFSAYFNWNNQQGQDLETAANNTVQLVSIVIPPLRAATEKAFKGGVEDFNTAPDFKSYNASLRAIAEQAASSAFASAVNQSIRDNAQRAADGARAAVEKRQAGVMAEWRAAQQSRRNAQARLDGLQAELKKVEEDLPRFEDALQDELGQQVGEAEKKAEGRLSAKGAAFQLTGNSSCNLEGRGRGVGPCYNAIRNARDAAIAVRDNHPQAIAEAAQQLTQARDADRRLEQQAAEISKQLGEIEQRRVGALSGEHNLTSIGRDLRDALDKLAQSASTADFDRVATLCDSIRENLPSGIEIANRKPQDIVCRPDAVLRLTQAAGQRREVFEDFSGRCGPSIDSEVDQLVKTSRAKIERVTGAGRAELLDTMYDGLRRNLLQPCLNLASALGVQSDLPDRMIEFIERNTARQNNLSTAWRAVETLFGVGGGRITPSHSIAASITLLQEGYFFGAKLVYDSLMRRRRKSRADSGIDVDWEPQPADPPMVASAKWLLSRSKPVGRRGLLFDAVSIETAPDEMKSNINALLRQLGQDGHLRSMWHWRRFFGRGDATLERWLIPMKGVLDLERIVVDHYRRNPW